MSFMVKLRSWLCCLAALAARAFPAGRPTPDERFFDKRVAPVLIKRCIGCHNRQLNNGGISFFDRDSLLKGGSRGPAIVPGRPEQSVLVDVVRHDGEIQMPPGPKLPSKEIAILTDWIRRGAVWGTRLQK
jgi:Planctomycete cytochrome C